MGQSNKKNQIYDVIDSRELDNLYRKNSQLLASLSCSNQQNEVLETELHSVIKERARKDVKNIFLSSRVNTLKEQISFFAKQQRNFNKQSQVLKKELSHLKISETGSSSKDLKNAKKQNQMMAKKLIHYLAYRKKIKLAHRLLKNKVQSLESQLVTLASQQQIQQDEILKLNKSNQSQVQSSEHLEKGLQDRIQKLAKKQDEILEENNSLREQTQSYKKTIDQSSNKNIEKVLHGLIQTLKTQQESLLKENESFQKQIKRYENKKGFAGLKLHLQKLQEDLKIEQKEKSILNVNYNNLRKISTQQEEGFNQSMFSFQKKYKNNQAKLDQAEKNLQSQSANLLATQNLLQKNKDSFEIEHQAIKQSLLEEKNSFKKDLMLEKQSAINNLSSRLQTTKDYNQELEKNFNSLKGNQAAKLLEQRNEFSKEISVLKSHLETQKLKHEENKESKIQDLKNEYEARINRLNNSFEKKLQHIQAEMENDFLSERRRSEVFRSIKEDQISKLKIELEQLQKESHKYKTNSFALEKASQETLTQLKKEISKSKGLEGQNENLSHLWHEIQQKLETRDQQVQSLQKLNKDLSLSFSQINSKQTNKDSLPKQADLFNKNNLKFVIKKSGEKINTVRSEENSKNKSIINESKNINNFLADIHFDS